ncbi:alpha-keto acid decarboxylase family protein [Sporolactobacillus laevolacticus]|uniref:alpha-keto acid decarboxylase family protein n=1 Tax=Sporolactobacillus laevolacticus TaxID=33018 RepID=UPI0025B2E91F|nr:thiamine pyrophosphate-binding protein [Sporolactobacillus laevolacticus]MDN3954588.1 thiamine pyrophosphate-binding protein [Sporolactobacillus laevolacticus]
MQVGEFLFECLKNEGITDIFGVPGDYNFSLLDQIEKDGEVRFVHCRNELNAGYAADGYARVKGIGALITTFGVGELSACNAIAGAYSESVPIIHIVGGPKSMMQMQHKPMHHTLLDGNFDTFKNMYEQITAYAACITPENAGIEIPNAIQKARETKKPVYLTIPTDVVTTDMTSRAENPQRKKTDKASLKEAVRMVTARLQAAEHPVILPDVYAMHYGLGEKVEALAQKMNVPVVTMMMGKGGYDESLPNYAGFYCGKLSSNKSARELVENSDCVLAFGAVWDDYNTGLFTDKIDPLAIINVMPNYVQIGKTIYPNIIIDDMIEAFPTENHSWTLPNPVAFPFDQMNPSDGNLSADSYYPQFQNMLKERDIVVTESGTFAWGLAEVRLKKGTTYITQGGWGAIGYALPAAFGACIAAPNRRVLLFTGEGSMQMNVQELSSMLENGCKPIIFILNNKGYTIEKYINTVKSTVYNNFPDWAYHKLPEVFQHEAFTVQVSTDSELRQAISEAEQKCVKQLCIIEMMVTPMDAPEIIHRMHETVLEMENKSKGLLSVFK